MKNKFYWIGSVVILFLSVICFVVFGVGTEIIAALTGESNSPVFGKYDGKKIQMVPGTDFANAVQNYANYYQNQGANLDENTYFYIYNYAFNSAVQAMTYKSEVAKSGYKPSAKSVNRILLPYFSRDGKYDPELYNQITESDRNAMKKDITSQLSYMRFSDDVFGSSEKVGENTLFGLKESSKEAEFLQAMAYTKRSFEMATFDKTAYPDSEVKAYAAEKADMFNKYSMSVVSVKEEAQAKKLVNQLKNNEVTFEDAVKEYSEKWYSNGDGLITDSYEYQIKENLANADDFSKIAALEKDAVSEAIKTNNGYSIYKNNGDKVAADFNNAETFEAVKNYIKTNESGRIEDYFMAKANAFVEKAKSTKEFSAACESQNVKYGYVPAVPLNYGEVSFADKVEVEDVPEMVNASTNENLLQKAFALKFDEISEPIVNGNYILVLKLSSDQKVDLSDEAKAKIPTSVKEYDQSSAQSAVLTSKKVENKVAEVYFNN
ncbi:MAG: SurA N-terminal domain-containing protein, partial [Treponema sp.]|nr:SurA N-terminal domain-containing protein [Candidatus Treponema equifaecale]